MPTEAYLLVLTSSGRTRNYLTTKEQDFPLYTYSIVSQTAGLFSVPYFRL